MFTSLEATNCILQNICAVHFRHVEGNVYELLHEEVIPVRLLSDATYFPYKYFITRKDKDGKYEHYIRGGKSGEKVNRILCLPQIWRNVGGYSLKSYLASHILSSEFK